jgi:hypothetical protein
LAGLNDVVEGNNGECKPSPLCTAQPGWDGPTGLGTPIGTLALTSPARSNRLTVNAPAQQFSAVGNPVVLHVRATDSARSPVRLTATDLPDGLRLNAVTGLIYGVPSKPGTHSTTVTATDSSGARANAVISWVVSTRRGAVVNGDFEAGTGGWTQSADVIREDGQYSNDGLGYAMLGGYGTVQSDSVSQRVAVPGTGRPQLHFAVRVSGGDKADALEVSVDGKAVRTLTGAQSGSRYVAQSVDLTGYRGRTVTLAWTSSENDGAATSFLLDDIAITR